MHLGFLEEVFFFFKPALLFSSIVQINYLSHMLISTYSDAEHTSVFCAILYLAVVPFDH